MGVLFHGQFGAYSAQGETGIARRGAGNEMAISFSKWLKWGGGVCAVLVVAMLAMPKLLSSSYVKTRISEQLSAISGHPVVLQGVSSVSLSPYLSVIYRDIRIADTTPGATEPLVHVEAMRAKLSVFSALWGGARLSEIHLIRPEFNFKIDRQGTANFRLVGGPLADRLALPAQADIPNLSLGTITVEDAHLVFEDERSPNNGQLPNLDATGVTGQLNWPSINGSADMSGRGIVRGELVSFSASIEAPLTLMRGGVTQLSATTQSTIAETSFDGSVSWAERTAEGQVTALVPTATRFLGWLGDPVSPTFLPGQMGLEGQMTMAPGRVEFLNSTFTFNGHRATGRMLVTQGEEERLKLGGTLAFDTLPLAPVDKLLAMSGDVQASDGDLLGFDLDMRLSANQADSAPFSLTNLAAAAYVRGAKASFDIGQANLLGGTVSGSVDLEKAIGTRRIATRLGLANVDLEQLSALFGQPAMRLSGSGQANFNLKASGQNLDGLLRHLNGEVRVAAQSGRVLGLNMEALAQQADTGGIVQQAEGETGFDDLDLRIFVANGTAFFNQSRMSGPGFGVQLGGRADVTTGSMALRGAVRFGEETEEPEKPLPFFVGGSTRQPLIVPLPGSGKKAQSRAEEDATQVATPTQ
ncbi:MAG: AsmA family protein [Pseudomonadota bacterium]